MKKVFITILICIIVTSCKKEISKTTTSPKLDITAINSQTINNAVVYEVNINHYSQEGTINAFVKDIPTLKKMGVKIIWLMPIQEIGITNRKATQDLYVDTITDSIEKIKYLGNPYSIKDYKKIKHDFGTRIDFKNLVKTAHKNGMYVILDWVANHTSWDHIWTKEHPEYYIKDKEGNLISPFDWKDVVELDYNNPAMRKAMLDEMKYWITEYNIDGFRSNVAAEIPTDFWENTRKELTMIKPVLMVAEAENSKKLSSAFDIQYAWKSYAILNEIAKGKKDLKIWDDYRTQLITTFQDKNNTLNFTSNQDENFWNGSEYERLGDAVETFTALTYLMPGTPLIYNGQEYDVNRKLRLYEKDTISHTVGKMMTIYEKLGRLKSCNKALHSGKNQGTYNRIPTTNDLKIIAFSREKKEAKVIYVSNLTKSIESFSFPIEGNYIDYISGEKISFTKDQKISFNPWEYKILIPE